MKIAFVIIALITTVQSKAQENYWQQSVSYDIKAILDDKEKTISGFETIVYKNNAPDTLAFIWFHLWANAYKDKSTALIQQILNDESRSKKMLNYGVGYIDGLVFSLDGKPAQTEAHPNPQYIDIIKLLLNKPLLPGDSVVIATPFKVKLPPYFSRSGYADGEFMACQWYPKPAVYDRQGWHEMPYLDMGEFYSEYANFSVHITLPSDYVVSATGKLRSEAELATYKRIGSENLQSKNGQPVSYLALDNSKTKTLHFEAENVPDFAWFADKDFVIQYDTINISPDKIIDAFSFYHNKKKTIWYNSIDYIKDGIRTYSRWIGDYEYPVVQVVEGPKNNSSGGMEYPMVTLITSPDAKQETLDAVIVHEVGHNWFMAMLGNNERAHTWMDEGLNSYFQFRYEAEKYRGNSIFGDAIPKEIKALPVEEFLDKIYDVINKSLPLQSAMETSAENFKNSDDYGITSYVKTALWLHMLESSVGWDKMQLAMQNYFRKWKFKHPQPADMQAAFEEVFGGKLNNFFNLINKQGKFN